MRWLSLAVGMSVLAQACAAGEPRPRAAPEVASSEPALDQPARLQCPPGRGDCDLVPENGCEADLNDADNCRFCGHTCQTPGVANAGCFDGACRIIACTPGHCDRDGQPETGCESDSCS